MNTKHTPGHAQRATAELTAELDTLMNTESLTLNGDTVRTIAARADGAARQVFHQRDELLAALRAARQELRFANVNENGEQRPNTPVARTLRVVDAAIAKATEE